jgi:hypothetical protein
MRHLERGEGKRGLAFERDRVAVDPAKQLERHLGRGRRLMDGIGLVGSGGDDITRLVLAEPYGMGRPRAGRCVENYAMAASEGHLGDRHQKPAVGDVVHR